MRPLKSWGGPLGVSLSIILVCLFLPLGSALEIGGDEGFELIKGLMCSRGFHLYTQIWNDQPPVSTMVLAAVFKAFGPKILAARILAAGYGLALVLAFYELIRMRSGSRAAIFASFLLVAAPATLMLMVSVMLEVPAFALALVSAWMLFRWEGGRRGYTWLLGSGATMAVALQTKFTAALVAPPILAEFLLLCRDRRKGRRRTICDGCAWLFAFVVVISIIGVTWGRGSLQSSWRSHTSTATELAPGVGWPSDYKFDFKIPLNHFEAVVGAAACIALLVRRRRLREVAFPVVLLATVVPIHLVHRPWWDYYYLHLSLPLCWLAGWTLNELIREIQRRSQGAVGIGFLTRWPVLLLCVLTALAIAKSERRLEGTIKFIRGKPKTADNPIVQWMLHHAPPGGTIYSEQGVYAFHAGQDVIPELAIVMAKRFWSGQITTEEIIETCKQKHAELLVIRTRSMNQEWRSFLALHCLPTARDGQNELYRLR